MVPLVGGVPLDADSVRAAGRQVANRGAIRNRVALPVLRIRRPKISMSPIRRVGCVARRVKVCALIKARRRDCLCYEAADRNQRSSNQDKQCGDSSNRVFLHDDFPFPRFRRHGCKVKIGEVAVVDRD